MSSEGCWKYFMQWGNIWDEFVTKDWKFRPPSFEVIDLVPVWEWNKQEHPGKRFAWNCSGIYRRVVANRLLFLLLSEKI